VIDEERRRHSPCRFRRHRHRACSKIAASRSIISKPASTIKGELAIVEAAVKQGTPVIGICHDCQVLAAVLAARVYPG